MCRPLSARRLKLPSRSSTSTVACGTMRIVLAATMSAAMTTMARNSKMNGIVPPWGSGGGAASGPPRPVGRPFPLDVDDRAVDALDAHALALLERLLAVDRKRGPRRAEDLDRAFL